MNGRMYDPVVGRMLSTDNNVNGAYSALGYDRYAYALNNPLKYTDPSGEFIFTILATVIPGAQIFLPLAIAMDIGGGMNLGVKMFQGKIDDFGDVAVAYGIGAAAGAAGFYTGGAAFAAAGGGVAGAGGFVAGVGGGMAGSAASLPILSIGNEVAFKDPRMTAKQYIQGIALGGMMGGVFNGVSALVNGKSFWDGSVKPTPTSFKPIILDPPPGEGRYARNGTTPKGKIEVGQISNGECLDCPLGEFKSVGAKDVSNPEFPGTDPTKPPQGFEWRGQPGSTPGSKNGNYYNPSTGESLRPDLLHPAPIGPHWDYKDALGRWFRIFPNGDILPK